MKGQVLKKNKQFDFKKIDKYYEVETDEKKLSENLFRKINALLLCMLCPIHILS